MLLPACALLDPVGDRLDFHLRQFQTRMLWRHAHCRLRGRDAPDHRACGRVARNDRVFRSGLAIEAQRNLLGYCVGAMTEKTLVRQDRPDVPVELEIFWSSYGSGCKAKGGRGN